MNDNEFGFGRVHILLALFLGDTSAYTAHPYRLHLRDLLHIPAFSILDSSKQATDTLDDSLTFYQSTTSELSTLRDESWRKTCARSQPVSTESNRSASVPRRGGSLHGIGTAADDVLF